MAPGASGTAGAAKVPAVIVAATPLTSTDVAEALTVPRTSAAAAPVRLRLAGEVIVTCGSEKRSTSKLSEAALPAASKAVIVIRLRPSASTAGPSKASPESVAAVPSISTRSMPLASLAVPVTEIEGLLVARPSVGEATCSAGGVASSVTSTAAVPCLPEPSEALTRIVFGPSMSGTLATKASSVSAAGVPSTVTTCTRPSSTTVPLTSICGVLSRLPSAGEAMLTSGASRSP